jgi:hypothetical protein
MYIGVNDVRQTKMHTAKPLVPEPILFQVEFAVVKLHINNQVLIKFQQNW